MDQPGFLNHNEDSPGLSYCVRSYSRYEYISSQWVLIHIEHVTLTKYHNRYTNNGQ